MATSLFTYAKSGINEEYGKITGTGSGSHVSGVLLMAWGIGDDELSGFRREIAVGNIDSDALFTLAAKPVDQESKVCLVSLCAVLATVVVYRGKLIFVDRLGVVKKTSNEGTFPIIYASAREESEEFFPFVAGKILINGFF
jgi:hypothetical protein